MTSDHPSLASGTPNHSLVPVEPEGERVAYNADNKVPPKKPSPENEVIQNQVGARLIIPDAELIAAASAVDSRIHHIRTPNFEATTAGQPMNEPEHARIVFVPVIEDILRRFPDREALAFRAAPVSINGTVLVEGLERVDHVPDITELVARGGDSAHSGRPFNVAVLKPAAEAPSTIMLDRVNQYAAKTSFIRDLAGENDYAPEEAAAIFPVVQVFDPEMLQSGGHNRWGVEFREGIVPTDALLAAYVLDSPDFTQQ